MPLRPHCDSGPPCLGVRRGARARVVLNSSKYTNLNRGQDTRANRTRDTQRAQAHNHTQNSNSRTHPTDKPHANTHLPNGERCPSTDDTAPHHSHTHSATPTRERARQWNHRLRELHRPLCQRLRPLPPLPLHLPTCRSRPTSSSWRRVRPAVLERTPTGFTTEKRRSSMESVTRLRERREKSPSPRRHYVQRPSRDNP